MRVLLERASEKQREKRGVLCAKNTRFLNRNTADNNGTQEVADKDSPALASRSWSNTFWE